MATQGLVTIRENGRVVMKIIAGDNGYQADQLAQALRRLGKVPAIQHAYTIAQDEGFGCHFCLVVMTTDDVYFDGDKKDLAPRFRNTFDQPEFNPRWARGTADHIVVIDL